MLKNLKICIAVFFFLTLVTGVIYPAVVTIVAQVAFPHQAQGSLIKTGDITTGSSLIAQKFVSPAYFNPRPSASDYGTLPSSASNLGPTSSDLSNIVEKRYKILAEYFGNDVPPEMLLASGSGLDPHISPENAIAQIEHIAKTRGLTESGKKQLAQLVSEHVEKPQFGIFGKARVCVLDLNLALDKLFGSPFKNGKV
jgi:K+-transporting ATPase ATPase C chain